MKKKLLLILLINLVISLFLNKMYFIVSMTLFLGYSFFLLSYLIYKKEVLDVVPTLVHGGIRNYKHLYIGEKNAYKITDGIDLRNIERNMYTDFLILKRYYGFLDKETGEICWKLNSHKSYLNNKNISMFDVCFLHEVTLMEHGYVREKQTQREYMNSILYLAKKLMKTSKVRSCTKEELDNLIVFCNECISFCDERNLRVKFDLESFVESDSDHLKNAIPLKYVKGGLNDE